MLDMILQILAVLGILLLALLAVFLIIVLLALFFPITYHIYGKKDDEGIRCSAKVKWLCGLLRVKYSYPEWGHLTVKALCFTLFDTAIPGDHSQEEEIEKKKSEKAKKSKKITTAQSVGTEQDPPVNVNRKRKNADNIETDSGVSGREEAEREGSDSASERENGDSEERDGSVSDTADASSGDENATESSAEDNEPKGIDKIFLKFNKIKYTICRIYDKIKKIWKNISYYMELLQEEETKQLFRYALFRIGKILRHIRPRHSKAYILFGTGAPDTTGYLYGVYCMMSAIMGAGFTVTPDFEQAVFQGEADVSGHITMWVLVWNGLKLFFDKRLRKFLKKMKANL